MMMMMLTTQCSC